MIGPEIQKAIYDALQAEPAIAGGNVFDRFDDRDPYPRVTIGEEQVVDDSNSCSSGWDVYTDIHVWSCAPGFPEAKTIAAAVAERVLGITSIAGFALLSVDVDRSDFVRDPDGLTSHGIVTAHFIIDQA